MPARKFVVVKPDAFISGVFFKVGFYSFVLRELLFSSRSAAACVRLICSRICSSDNGCFNISATACNATLLLSWIEACIAKLSASNSSGDLFNLFIIKISILIIQVFEIYFIFCGAIRRVLNARLNAPASPYA
jgi:hypothetical protein